MKCLSRLTLTILFFSHSTFAQMINPTGKNQFNPGSEFYVGTELGRPLITVNVIRGVKNPGVYRIPANTNMAELLSYSGGALENSDLTKIQVRNIEGRKSSDLLKVYNFEQLVADRGEFPVLNDRDIIVIQQQQSLDTTMKWLGIASMITSIAMAIVVVSDRD